MSGQPDRFYPTHEQRIVKGTKKLNFSNGLVPEGKAN